MKKIAVVTVNYSRSEATKQLLESIEQSVGEFDLEIIVVDNGPDEHFVLSKKNRPTVKVIRPGTNTGFAGGNNIGIKEAQKQNADYILLVNDDAFMEKETIKNLLDVIERDQKIGVAVPKIYFAKGHEFHKERYKKEELGKVIWFAGGYYDWKNAKSVHRGVDEVDRGQYDKVEQIDFATGCCMLIRSDVIKKVGLFDERYFLYYEDGDLDMRIQQAGYKICYAPSAIIYHENASSSGGAGNKLHDYFLTRNQMLFGMKYAPFRTKLALLRQSIKLLSEGRPEQKKAIKDFYLGKFGKGSFLN